MWVRGVGPSVEYLQFRHISGPAQKARNHPSGDPSPSRQDLETHRPVSAKWADSVGIAILDHVVVAADGFIYLAERGWI
jgi:DNA repair protein RadC